MYLNDLNKNKGLGLMMDSALCDTTNDRDRYIARIDVYSHCFVMSRHRPAAYNLAHSFSSRYVEHDLVKMGHRFVKKPKRVYAAATVDRREFRFHINALESFLNHAQLNHVKRDEFDFRYHTASEYETHIFKVIDKRSPRAAQVPLIDYLTADGITKVLALNTGGGKTFCALTAIARLKRRTIINLPGKFVEKWKGDVEEAFDLKSGEFYVIRGAKDLKNVMNLAISGELEAGILIITLGTMQNYIKEYEQKHPTEFSYPIRPIDFYQQLGIGLRITDEAHMMFHLNFKIETYTHINKVCYLSATLDKGDPFLDSIIEIMYPPKLRMKGEAPPKYIDVFALAYSFKEPKRVPHKRRGSYSHTRLEESILTQANRTDEYLELIEFAVNKYYVEDKLAGQKLLVYAATVQMCDHIVERLSEDITNLSIARYVSEDDYSVLMSNDIVVTTLGSAGTAVDIEDLSRVILTVSQGSLQGNQQVLGRLRELKNYPGEHPKFIYIFAKNIDKHVAYHNQKPEQLAHMCRSFTTEETQWVIS
ncbi:DEAD/DEAH box helicase family protein [Endozoicomonas sp. ONNA1]|uniref:DEAD/DEAH box helicase family protein n=1 Tax=Endozoicomonas sp. ONNA1 TaxID=2828740 RepID=UPI0021485E17|nr:DEAD/DEAH box helicase family protein [Endozoicomonas sp. ONNA1]